MRLAIGLATAIVLLAWGSAVGAANSYDGSYVGTSANFTGTTSSKGKAESCVQFKAPYPLTIANGHAQTKWGDGAMQGDVGPDGKLVMHSSLAGRFDGQIDASGALKGNFEGYCVYALTWQRKG